METYNITLRRLSNGYWETTSYDGKSELSSKYEVIIQDVGQKYLKIASGNCTLNLRAFS